MKVCFPIVEWSCAVTEFLTLVKEIDEKMKFKRREKETNEPDALGMAL
jgi:hypothetical protein